MKRLWLGVFLLVLLLGLGIWTCIAINQTHREISADLSDALSAAQDGNWFRAAELSGKAQAAWDHAWRGTAALSNHEPMEKIDGLFSQLRVYLNDGDMASFCACCALLCVLTEALGEEHVASWWNFL